MKTAGLPILVLSLALVAAGCSREGKRGTDPSTGGTPEAGGATTPGTPKGSWTYYSKEHDFSVQLPSADWKQRTKNRFIADFWRQRAGAPMLAGVTSAKKQTREEFQASIPRFKADLEKNGDFLLKPTFQEGKTDSGNPYVFAAMCERGGDSGSQFIYVATATVWLAEKGLTVSTMFEGQGQMKSKVFQAAESSDFEAAARSICLSPK